MAGWIVGVGGGLAQSVGLGDFAAQGVIVTMEGVGVVSVGVVNAFRDDEVLLAVGQASGFDPLIVYRLLNGFGKAQ